MHHSKTWKYVAAFLLGLAFSTNAYSTTFVLVTVDVESRAQGNPNEQIWGRMPGVEEEWGIPKIMNILDRHAVKGTFYLNVYEHVTHGELPIKQAALAIHRRNHDLQLHTHPQPMYGMYGMSHAAYEKQLEILLKGIDLIQGWTGKTVIAHRAGAYEANTETIRAVKDSGLLIDSSLALNSPMAKSGYLTNRVFQIDDITEIPVTYYDQVKIGQWHSRRLIDIEGTTFYELKNILEQASNNDLCSVNIMMHSFSLSRYGIPDPDVAQRLDALLLFVKNHDDLEVVTTTEFYERSEAGETCANLVNFVPSTGFILTYLRAVEDFDKGFKNKVVALGVPAALFFLCLVVICVYRLITRHRRVVLEVV